MSARSASRTAITREARCRPCSKLTKDHSACSRGPWIDHFGDNFLWSNATLIIKGMAPYGVVALEEIDRVCERLKPRQGETRKAWCEEWGALGDQIEKPRRRGRQRRQKAHRRRLLPARRHLPLQRRAVHPARPRKARNGRKRPTAAGTPASACATRASSSSRCPYEGTTLPALFMKSAGARPGADRRDRQRHGQRQGDEHLFLPGSNSPAAACTRSPWTGRARAKA